MIPRDPYLGSFFIELCCSWFVIPAGTETLFVKAPDSQAEEYPRLLVSQLQSVQEQSTHWRERFLMGQTVYGQKTVAGQTDTPSDQKIYCYKAMRCSII